MKKLIAVIIFCLIFSGNLYAKAAHSEQNVLLEPMQEAYPEPASIPIGYKGQSIEVLFKSVKKIIQPKDQYQTTAEYQEQQQAAIKENRQIFEGYILTEGDFVIGSYNADARELTLKIMIKGVFDNKRQDLGTYTASNAFGVTRQVQKEHVDIYSLSFKLSETKKPSVVPWIWLVENVTIPMEPDTARQIEGKIKALYIAQLAAPYVKDNGEDLDLSKPTIDNPEDRAAMKYSLWGSLRGIIFYNKETGQILYQKKFSEEELRQKNRNK